MNYKSERRLKSGYKTILKNLSNLDGPSGYEYKVIEYIKTEAEKIPNTTNYVDNQEILS